MKAKRLSALQGRLGSSEGPQDACWLRLPTLQMTIKGPELVYMLSDCSIHLPQKACLPRVVSNYYRVVIGENSPPHQKKKTMCLFATEIFLSIQVIMLQFSWNFENTFKLLIRLQKKRVKRNSDVFICEKRLNQ